MTPIFSKVTELVTPQLTDRVFTPCFGAITALITKCQVGETISWMATVFFGSVIGYLAKKFVDWCIQKIKDSRKKR